MNENHKEKKISRGRQRLGHWKSIIGGDILATDFFRRQTKLIVLIMLLVIFYVLVRIQNCIFDSVSRF